jgi:hypothetical protein
VLRRPIEITGLIEKMAIKIPVISVRPSADFHGDWVRASVAQSIGDFLTPKRVGSGASEDAVNRRLSRLTGDFPAAGVFHLAMAVRPD